MSYGNTGRALHVDVALSNLVTNRRPEGFIADQFIPQTPVGKQSDMFWRKRFGHNFQYEAGLTYRAPGTEPRKVNMSVTSDVYFAPNYALGADWPIEDEVNADAVLNWAQSKAVHLMDRLMIDYEYRVAQFAVNTTNVRTVTLVGCGWFNKTAPILTHLLDYREKFRQATGMLPNTLLIPIKLQQYIQVNNELRDILFGDGGGLVSDQAMAGLIGVDRVLSPRAQVNTSGFAETVNGSWSFADVWGSDSIWMAYTSTLAGQDTDTWINAFRWTNPSLGTPFAVERWPYDYKAKKYDLAVGYYQTEKVISSDLAMRIIVNSQ